MKNFCLLMLLSSALLACADPYRNLYEGMQQREGIANPQAPARESVPYEQYKTEREKAQKNSSERTE